MLADARKALSPGQVGSELKRLGLNEWAFIRECARADRCSVNLCPMDPLIALRSFDPGDRETKCLASKPDRERYVSRMSPDMRALLPFGGLLESEWNRRQVGRARFASLSPEERARVVEMGRQALAALKKARLGALSNLTAPAPPSDPSGEPKPTTDGANADGAALRCIPWGSPVPSCRPRGPGKEST